MKFDTLRELQDRRALVIDSFMGSGKTEYCIQLIKELLRDNHKVLYVTPFLDEVQRVVNESKIGNRKLYQPSRQNENMYKLDSLIKLLRDGRSIATTHELFKLFNNDCCKYIQEQGYILILDEVFEPLKPYDKCTSYELDMLIEYERFTLNEFNLISMEDNYSFKYGIKNNQSKFGLYQAVTKDIKEERILYTDIGIYFWQFPIKIFKAFKKVIVSTFLFENSFFGAYFQINKMTYHKKSVKCAKGFIDKYSLVDYTFPNVSEYRNLIAVVNHDKNMFKQTRHTMSVSWFKKNINDSRIEIIKNAIYNFITNRSSKISGKKITQKDILWTTFKCVQKKLQGKGYTSSFTFWNNKATNEFGNRHCVVHAANILPNPITYAYVKSKGANMTKDMYSLTDMIQFVWRSAIRNKEPIILYIVSDRMADIFQRFMFNEELKPHERYFPYISSDENTESNASENSIKELICVNFNEEDMKETKINLEELEHDIELTGFEPTNQDL